MYMYFERNQKDSVSKTPRHKATNLGHQSSKLVPGHAGEVDLEEVDLVLGEVDVRVADAAELYVELDVPVPADVALDVDLLEGAVRGLLGESLGLVHLERHLDS